MSFGLSDDDQESPLKTALSFAGISITQQPVSTVGVIGGQCSFGPVLYTSQFPVVPVLQWQIQDSDPTFTGTDTWAVLEESPGFYEGVATNTLTVKNLDNFLAAMPLNQFNTTGNAHIKFRCALFYPGAAAIYTNSVTVTIAKYAVPFCAGDITWFGGLVLDAGSALNGNPASVVLNSLFEPTAVGFAGPYTYLWTYVSGDAFTCVDPTVSLPTWNFTGSPGWHFSYWKCTISNGANSIPTDPYLLGAYFSAAPVQFTFNPFGDNVSVNGAEVFTNCDVPPGWVSVLQRKVRTTAARTITATTPDNTDSCAFTIDQTPPGGTWVAELVTTEDSTVNPTRVDVFLVEFFDAPMQPSP